MKTVVVIPTYNERENISSLVERILSIATGRLDLFFIDDGSPDGTGQLLNTLSAMKPRVRVLHRPAKLGLGTAYRQAYRLLLKEGYSRFIQMDADLSHQPEVIPALLDAAEAADLVIGSRYCAGGGSKDVSAVRWALSCGANRLTRLMLGLVVEDSTAGFRCYRRELLEVLDQLDIRSTGYAFQVEMTYYSQLLGFRVREVPITFEKREHAKSKMSRHEVSSGMKTLARLWLHRASGKEGTCPSLARDQGTLPPLPDVVPKPTKSNL